MPSAVVDIRDAATAAGSLGCCAGVRRHCSTRRRRQTIYSPPPRNRKEQISNVHSTNQSQIVAVPSIQPPQRRQSLASATAIPIPAIAPIMPDSATSDSGTNDNGGVTEVAGSSARVMFLRTRQRITSAMVNSWIFVKEFVTDPDSTSYSVWLWVISLAALYNVIFIPLRAAYIDLDSGGIAFFILDYCIADPIYLIDIFVRMRTTYFASGIVVTDHTLTRTRYIKSWQFVFDVVSLLPTDLIYIGVGPSYTLVRINRFLRVPRISEAVTRTESIASFPNIFRFVVTVSYILITIHFLTCIYYAYSRWMGFGQNAFVLDAGSGRNSFLRRYGRCYYWSTLMLTLIGEMPHGTTNLELMFTVGVWLSGFVLFATIVGRITVILDNISENEEFFRRSLDMMRIYMDNQGVTGILGKKIKRWFLYTYDNRLLGGEEKVLHPLPDQLRCELAMTMHFESLRRVKLFQDMDKSLLQELVLHLHLQVFSPGEYVCRKGDIGKEMYIIKKGNLEVVSDDGSKVFVTMLDGTAFGEISLLNMPGNKTGNRRTANVRSKGFSDLFTLSKEALYACLKDYPGAMQKLTDKGVDLLRKENKLDEEAQMRQQHEEEHLLKRIAELEKFVEEAETRFARLIADMTASRQAARRRVEIMEAAFQLPPLPEGLTSPTNKDPIMIPSPMPGVSSTPSTIAAAATPGGTQLLVEGIGPKFPQVKLLPPSPNAPPTSTDSEQSLSRAPSAVPGASLPIFQEQRDNA